MREVYEAMITLTQLTKKFYGKGIFTELLIKRISGFSIPTMFTQCHAYFYNAIEELKMPKEHRRGQEILKKRYDVSDIEAVSFDMIYLRRDASQMVDHSFERVEEDYVPEQFYAQQFAPTIHSNLFLLNCQRQYYQEALKGRRSSQEEISRMEANLGLFAIGFPFSPYPLLFDLQNKFKNKIRMPQGSKNLLTEYLEFNSNKKAKKLVEVARKLKQCLQQNSQSYTWLIRMWILEPQNIPFKQGRTTLETIINSKRTRYDQIKVEQVPFFFGEHSQFCPKHFNFFNQMDDSIQGMHLCLGLLQQSRPLVQPQAIKEGMKLALINYSCNGWNLRLQLLPGRKWRLTNGLVIQKDPPQMESDETEIEEEQFSQHFVYEVKIGLLIQGQFTQDHFSLQRENIERGIIKDQSLIKKLAIQIVNFQTKQVVDLVRPGEQFDSLKVIIYDPVQERDVTDQFEENSLSKEQKMIDVQKGSRKIRKLEVCFINQDPKERAFVWARGVVSQLRTSRFSHIPIEYFATYFEWDLVHSERDLTRAPTTQATGADVLSFGSQRFKFILIGDSSKRQREKPSLRETRQQIVSLL